MKPSNLFVENERGHSREKLIEAATELFSDKGFHAVSVKDICNLAQVNISAVSYHFGGKEGLLNEVLESLLEGPFESLESYLGPADSYLNFRRGLEEFLNQLGLFYLHSPRVLRLLFQELEHGFPEAERVYSKVFERLGHSLRSYLDQGRALGYLRDSKISNDLIVLQLMAPFSELLRCDRCSKRMYGISLMDPDLKDILIPFLLVNVLNPAPQVVNYV